MRGYCAPAWQGLHFAFVVQLCSMCHWIMQSSIVTSTHPQGICCSQEWGAMFMDITSGDP